VAGITSLAVTIPVAALTLTLVAGWSTAPLLDAELLLIGLGLTILFPVVPFTLEFLAVRRLTAGAFGTLDEPRAGDRLSDRPDRARAGAECDGCRGHRVRRGGRHRH
jgi:hypothetical protein